MESIGEESFDRCLELSSITLGRNVSNIETGAFLRCTKLENIYVSEENEYFSSIDGILYDKKGEMLVLYPPGRKDSELTIPDGIKTIGKGCFSTNKYLRRIIVPSSVSRIGEDAFSECSINSIALPDTLKVIENNTFSYCSELTNLEIPESVKEIKDEAFYGSGLEHIELPSSLLSLGYNALSGTQIRNITIPASLRSIGGGALNSSKLKSIEVSGESESFVSTSGVLFDKNRERRIDYPTERDEALYIVPEGVIEIGDGAFLGSKLKKVVLPSSIKKIGKEAFDYCKKLKDIVLPSSLLSIGESAFSYCCSLEEISFSKNGRTRR